MRMREICHPVVARRFGDPHPVNTRPRHTITLNRVHYKCHIFVSHTGIWRARAWRDACHKHLSRVSCGLSSDRWRHWRANLSAWLSCQLYNVGGWSQWPMSCLRVSCSPYKSPPCATCTCACTCTCTYTSTCTCTMYTHMATQSWSWHVRVYVHIHREYVLYWYMYMTV